MKPTDKIKVEVEDLRDYVRWFNRAGQPIHALEIQNKYPAAFVPEEKWEDVTERCMITILGQHTEMTFASFKFENNRIWRKKSISETNPQQ